MRLMMRLGRDVFLIPGEPPQPEGLLPGTRTCASCTELCRDSGVGGARVRAPQPGQPGTLLFLPASDPWMYSVSARMPLACFSTPAHSTTSANMCRTLARAPGRCFRCIYPPSPPGILWSRYFIICTLQTKRLGTGKLSLLESGRADIVEK